MPKKTRSSGTASPVKKRPKVTDLNNNGRKNKKYKFSPENIDLQGKNLPPSDPPTRDNSLTLDQASMSSQVINDNNKPKWRPDLKNPVINKVLPKPVFVESNHNVVANHINGLTLKCRPLLKIINSTKIQIQCDSNEDKKILVQSLKDKQFSFHTFTEPNEKPLVFLLKGFYKENVEQMMTILQEANVPAEKVSVYNEKNDNIIFMVHIMKDSAIANVNVMQHQHKVVNSVIVKWEAIDRRRKRPTQCFRCQDWGHSATNCGRPRKCVKCLELHEPGQCARRTREGTAKCVNCQGDHPANNRTCPAFIKWNQRSTRQSQNRPLNHHQPRPTWTPESFPQLPRGQNSANPRLHKSSPVSFAQTLTSNENVATLNAGSVAPNSFAALQAQFSAIPEISETMRLFGNLIKALNSTNSQHERMGIMMQYCMPSSTENVN